ncbi:hypothetical protein SAMN05428988_3136 [Chitinophaga sp. YR573]|uniref:hypothetical protein n=1 Tax=Chitinophaga sp. YR573 TaxID=1881040 RepID=UPI0008C0E5C8|nr:hypothetical protein [Chitinophaga sp. YR573]SEW20815.1 hypothetical protein SAMN05428988_3136 [Chitinophaga sp. YR573]
MLVYYLENYMAHPIELTKAMEKLLEDKDSIILGPKQLWNETLGDINISTTFTGNDISLGASSPPLVFETYIYTPGEDHEFYEYRENYSTYQQAENGHKKIVDMVKAAEKRSKF